MEKPFLSVVVPAFNEAENLKKHRLDDVYAYLRSQSYSFELVLVDDGSTDSTLEQLQHFADRKPEVLVVPQPHQGKAGTVRAGMLAAHGLRRLFSDFDQSTPIEEVEKILPFFDRGYDIVIGSREVEGALRDKEPWYRHLMGKGFNLVVQILAVRGVHDTQCGFKAFSENATNDLFPRLVATASPKKDAFTGAFDVELLFLARKRGYRTAEVPVQWKHVKTQRVSPIKDSLRMFWQLVLIRWAYICGRYA
jgi:glycosyltransferase involved in cell wall biosynthesis